ncbi:MAG: Rpn family recombination-promoting nuclease/putative transposase [Bacteroidota bacterium]
MRYLDPKNDLTFKKVFGEHPHLLKSFLNAMLPLDEGGEIESLEYLPSEMAPQIPVMKNTIVDVRCKDKNGRQFIVEMQIIWTDSFMQRVLFNASKAYVKQLEKGEHYNQLQPVYALSLIDEIYEKGEEFFHHYKIVNTQNPERQIKGLEFVFVELPKFKPDNLSQKKLQVLWLRFLTEIDENSTEIAAELMNQSEIRDAIECLQESAFTKGELELYERYWDIIRVERTRIEDAEVKGRAEGLEQGTKIASYKTAVNGFKRNMTDADISELTGLSTEAVVRLRVLFNKYGQDTESHFDET